MMTLEQAFENDEFNLALDTYDFPKAFSFLNKSADREKLFLLLQEENLNPLMEFKDIPDFFLSGGSQITKIIIPDGVTSIGYRAFIDSSSLTSVEISDSVTEIGSDAFSSCYSLTGVVIGNGVTYIGSYAFSGCSNLKKIIFKGTKKQAIKCGIGNRSDTEWNEWRENSPITEIICTDGVIEL